MSPARAHGAIVGAGQSRIGKVPGRTALEPMLDATDAALASAGLTLDAIDGLISVPSRTEEWFMPAAVIARGLGIEPRFLNTMDLTGASGAAMVDQAVRAVATGACDAVLCLGGDPLLSGMSRDRAVAMMARSAGHPDAEAHTGIPVPALYALVAARHMHVYGTTPDQLAAVAVQMRRHAALNPNAHFTAPITIADVHASKMIATPLHMLDCAPVSDGAGAMIVVSTDRARTLKKKPAYLLGSGYGLSHAYLSDAEDLMVTGARKSGATAFAAAGLTPRDMQFAELYDCFTITLLMELEELGFCKHGEAGAFVAGGGIDRAGAFPVNTNGGLLSGGHSGLSAGLYPVIETALQVMGEAGARQLPRADLGLAHSNGGIIGMHCSLVLGSANV